MPVRETPLQLVPPYLPLPSLGASFLREDTYKGSGGILGPRRGRGEEKGHLRNPAHRSGPDSSWRFPNVNHQLAQSKWKGQLYYV